MKPSRFKLLILNFVLIISLLFITTRFINKKNQERLLKNEIEDCLTHINDNNITKRLAISNQKGPYKTVEQSIKKYLLSVVTDINQIKSILNNIKEANIISIENIKNNKDNLPVIKEYITTTKYKLNQHTFKLISYLTNDGVMSFLDKDIDSYCINLYKEYVVIPEAVVRNNINDLKMNINKILNYLDSCNEIISFLENNKDFWSVTDNITFINDNLLNQYNLLLDKLK